MDIKILKGILESNTYVVEFDGTYIIIDAGAHPDSIKRALGGKMPSAILLTHEHFDHMFYLADYLNNSGECRVYCHPATLEELKTNKFHKRFGNPIGMPMQRIKNFDNFNLLRDNEIINIGPFEIKAVFAPGHSEGCVLYLVPPHGTNISIFTGDVLFRNNIGRTDFIKDGELLMQKSLRKLQPLEFETSYHGHGSPCSFEAQQKNIAKHLDS